jgi:hypothetical protein
MCGRVVPAITKCCSVDMHHIICSSTCSSTHVGMNTPTTTQRTQDAATLMLASAVMNNPSLTQMQLANNRIGDAGAVALAEVRTLRTFCVWVRANIREAGQSHDIKTYGSQLTQAQHHTSTTSCFMAGIGWCVAQRVC